MKRLLTFITDIVNSRRGQLFFDVYRMRNSFLVGAGWAAYVMLSTVDMSFRGEIPSTTWSLTVGLPFVLADRLPLNQLIASNGPSFPTFAMYVILPPLLFVLSAAFAHLLFFCFAVARDLSQRKKITLLAANAANTVAA